MGGFVEAGWSPNRFRLFRTCAVNMPPVLAKVDEAPARTISDFPVPVLANPRSGEARESINSNVVATVSFPQGSTERNTLAAGD
jgi:hypothetical protein